MLRRVRTWLASSEVYSFNPVLRDRFVAAEAARIPPGARVLDVGAGSCPYRALFAHCRYESQDVMKLDDDQLRFGGYGRIDHRCDATAIPVQDASFDAVLCTEMLEHHPEPIKVVGELARILAPGGTLILTAPLGSGIHQEPYHFYGGYTPYWYQRFLAGANFESIRVVANAGSYRFFAQEAIRFLRTSAPWNHAIPLGLRVVWLPFWMLLLPLLGIIVPFWARSIDGFDIEQRFTVGYHVTAIRGKTRSP
ncbi:MAG: class I SAM-dependent methyltransferase [Burkholderiales bacterium]